MRWPRRNVWFTSCIVKSIFFNLAGGEGLWLFEAVAKLSAEWLATHQLLISTHGESRRRHVVSRLVIVFRPGLIELAVGIIGGIHVDQFHIPIGIRSAGRNEKCAAKSARRPSHLPAAPAFRKPAHRFCCRRSAGPRPCIPAARPTPAVVHERHRLGRIAHILIERWRVGRGRIERKPSTCAEIKRLRLRVFRRPLGIVPPHIRPSLEDVSLGKFRVAIAFKILLEKRKQNVLAVIVAGIGRELDPPQVFAVVTAPIRHAPTGRPRAR